MGGWTEGWAQGCGGVVLGRRGGVSQLVLPDVESEVLTDVRLLRPLLLPPVSPGAALLFGQLIHHSLVSNVSLGIALRYVLEALRTGAGSKMFGFAATALKQFARDLAQWPQYCTHLTQVRCEGAGLGQAARGC